MAKHLLGESAFPRPAGEFHGEQCGLSKRELFAAMAMQGALAANDPDLQNVHSIAKYAVRAADALIEVLSDDEVSRG